MRIQTERGFEEFQDIRKITKNKKIVLITKTSRLECTDDHRILVGKSKSGKIFRRAEKLKVGNKIKNEKIIDKIVEIGNFEFYDVVGVDGETYTTNGIESHNCNVVYIDECIEENETITVRDKKTGIVKKIKIKELESLLCI